METKLHIGNMSYETTEDELRTMFSEAGTVESVDIIKDHGTGRSKGFAFITMNSQEDAEKAISMFNEKTINERALAVSVARPREERPRSPGNQFSGRATHRSRGGSNNH